MKKLLLIIFIYCLLNPFASSSQGTWEKYEGNPILQEFSTWAANGIGSPCVIKEEGIYKLWFTGDNNPTTGYQIGYAESLDGINWTPNDDPVISIGSQDAWDEQISLAYVLRINDTLKMWYSGSPDGFSWEISIGYAWSLDGINWTKHINNPVLINGPFGSWEENGVYTPAVYYDGDIYHMWYNGYKGTSLLDPDLVGYATSIDGINWIKYADNPVMNVGEPGTFFDTWVQSNFVSFHEGEYNLWFAGYDGTSTNPMRYFRIGYANSVDGVVWNVQNDSLPVIDHGPSGSWDKYMVKHPSILIDEDQYKMWYAGYDGSSWGIGYAYKLEVGLEDYSQINISKIDVHPNPFTTTTTIEYTLDQPSDVTLAIFNHLGKQVELIRQNQSTGKQQIIWDAVGLLSGIYFFTLKAGDRVATGKMMLMR